MSAFHMASQLTTVSHKIELIFHVVHTVGEETQSGKHRDLEEINFSASVHT